ncbi:hypothetical protein M1O54_02680 [Dehalococcoidia bacterium]|nr:hypothetical protein [Dehalococcoidia bacterium]
MKKRLSLAILALLMLSLVAVGCPALGIRPAPEGPHPAPLKEWSETFGGPGGEGGYSGAQTACGGFIIAGGTTSFGAGWADFWLVKTDSQGNKKWSRTFGGPYSEWAESIQQTACGGFIIAGTTHSFGDGEGDFWLVKSDPQGNKEWSRTFGGPERDEAVSVRQTADGGFIIVGRTRSFGAGSDDFWLIKTDSQGNKEWSRTFGAPYCEIGHWVEQTVCGGFIVVGNRNMRGATWNIWLVKTDPQGNKEWSRTFPDRDWELAIGSSVQQTACGGFIIAGHTGKLEPDMLLIKTDAEGNEQWRRRFHGPEWDTGTRVQQTLCRGFIILGHTTSFGRGGSDFWLIKTDPQGNKEWSETFGGVRGDWPSCLQQTACGGFILAGTTESFGAGESDFWLIKLAPEE